MSKVLIVDDEESLRYTLMEFLVEEGYSVKSAGGLGEAKRSLENEDADIVVTDLKLGDGTGIDLLKFVKENLPFSQVIIITGYPEVETAAQAVRLGAFDYIVKPVRQETILHIVRLADRQRVTEEEKERLMANMTAIFQSVEDGIISIDMDMRVTEANGGIERICGFKRDEIINERHDLLDRDCSGRCSELLRKTLREKMVCIENALRCHHRDRPHQVVSIKTSPLFWGGTFRGAVMVLRDVTFFDPSAERASGMGLYRLVGESEPMKNVFRMIETLSGVDSTVLITGETGTGKELVAEAIHKLGPRSGGPLVKVNCSAFSAGLLESELFGHVKGAFTGAVSNRKGRFELAEGGTILLDEIGDLSGEIQVKLLRVLQEHRIDRLGDSRPIDVDVRVIAATHHDLRERVREGAFRADLFYRLNVVNIHIPPLRERKSDIPLLANYFVNEFNRRFKKPIEGVSNEVLSLLMEYDWPGNVRELRHVLEHASVVSRGKNIMPEDLPEDFQEGEKVKGPEKGLEMDEIIRAIKEAGGNKAKAARILGISRQTIYRKIRRG